jgi:hypothetical protein
VRRNGQQSRNRSIPTQHGRDEKPASYSRAFSFPSPEADADLWSVLGR